MKKIAVFFACGLLAASFIACSSPAEVHTKEAGEGALIGIEAGSPDDEESNSKVMVLD